MFRKALCWLLIIQHMNVYVLQATPGDIRVTFEEEAPSSPIKLKASSLYSSSKQSSSLSRRLRIFRESETSGKEEQLVNVLLEVDRKNTCKFTWGKISSLTRQNICVEMGSSRESVHISSTTKQDHFSFHLHATGLAQIQKMDISKHLDIETFGEVHIRHSIKAARLSLTGKSIWNEGVMKVDDLDLTAFGTANAKGQITNASSGQVIIENRATVTRGQFENQGRVQGATGSVFDLNGNDFTNRFLGQSLSKEFRSTVSWQGQFAIVHAGTFINESDITPMGAVLEKGHFSRADPNASLILDTCSLINKSYIFATSNLHIRTLKGLSNEGKMEGGRTVSLTIGGDLNNRNSIEAGETLNITVGNTLRNETTGILRGKQVNLDVTGLIRNQGLIKSRVLSLVTGKLENFGQIRIEENGLIQEKLGGAGLHNGKGARISATQTLKIVGQTLHNEGDQGGLGHIQARILKTHLDHLRNEGDVQATEKGTLRALTLTNTSSGTISFPKVGEFLVTKLINKGQVTGETLTGSIGTLENNGSIISSLDLILDIKKLLSNVGEAIMSSLRHFVLRGEGTLQNEGKLLSQGDIKVNLQHVLNHAHMISEEGIEVEAQEFGNTGLVLAPELSVTCNKGSNIGPFNEEVDASNFETLRGLVALQSLHLTTYDTFVNKGHITGGASLKLKGTGIFDNEGRFESAAELTAQIKRMTNKGVIHSQDLLTCEGLEEGLDNSGEILSQRELSIVSSADLTNTGKIYALKAMCLKLDTFSNRGEISSKESLTGEIGFFSNAKTLSSEDILNLSLGTLENTGVIRSKNRLGIRTRETSFNKGKVETSSSLHLGTGGEFLNIGDLTSLGLLAVDAQENFHNTGSMKGATQVNYKGNTLFRQEGNLSSSGPILVNAKKLHHTHLTETGGEVEINIEENLHNEGVVRGKEGLRITAGQIVNTHQFETPESMSLTSKGKTENHGNILAKKASLKGEAFVHHGTIRTHEELTFNFKGLTTAPKSLLSSKSDVNVTGDVLFLEGNLNAGQHVDVKGRRLTNKGDIHSQILTASMAESFINGGVFHGLSSVKVEGKALENEGTLSSGEDLVLISDRLTNHGNLEAEGKLSLTIGDKGLNTKVLKAKLLQIRGHTFENLSSDNVKVGEVDIEVQKLKNGGGLLARTTKIVAEVLENLGMIGTSENMMIEVSKLLKNAKDAVMSARGDLTFQGRGKLENDEEGEITSEGTFFSSLPEAENKGALKAARGVTFENLKRELKNFGLILSETSVRISSKSQVLNGGRAGIIEARKGPLSIVARDLTNHRLINALEGVLTLEVHQGENHNTLYGQHGIELTIGDLFTNYKLRDEDLLTDKKEFEPVELGILKSPETILLRGEGSFINQAYLVSGKDVEVETHLDNHGQIKAEGSIHSLIPAKRFFNEATGVVSVRQDIRIETTQPFMNRGTLRGAEAFIKTEGEFTNEGSILVTDRALTLQLQDGHNRGTLQAPEKVDVKIDGKLKNTGKILSPQTLLLTGEGDLTNEEGGFLRGDKTLSLQGLHLQNEGTLYSTHLIDLGHLRGPFINGEKGRVVSLENLTLHHIAILDNMGHLQGDQTTELRVEEFLNKGTVLAKEGSLSVSVQKGINGSTGRIDARKSADVHVEHLYLNEGEITAEDRLSFIGRGALINKGLVRGLTTFSLSLPSFENQGKVRSSSHIEIQGATEKLKNAKSGTMKSKGALIVRESPVFDNEGDMEAVTRLTLTLPELQNKGRIVSLKDSSVTVERGSNGHDALLRANADLIVDINDKFTNEGEVSAEGDLSFQGPGILSNFKLIHSEKDLVLETQELANEGEISSQQDIIIKEAARKLVNGKEATIISLGRLTLQNVGWLQNGGSIQGQAGIEATGEHLSNDNSISSLAGVLQLAFKTLENKSLGRIQTQQGLSLVLEDPFVNEGLLRSEKAFTFKGKTSLHNRNVMSGAEALLIDIPSLINDVEMGSDHSITLQDIEKSFNNGEAALIASQGQLTFVNSPYFTNKGRVSTRTLGLPREETVFKKFINEGTFLVSAGDLFMSLEEGMNSGVLKTSGALILTLNGLTAPFLNKKAGKVLGGSLTFKGTNSVHNEGQVHGESHLLYEAGDLTNEGSLSSLALVEVKRDFKNAPVFGVLDSGRISSLGTMILAGTMRSQNTGMVLGDKGITATFHTFTNSGIFSTSKGPMSVVLQEGSNEGTLGAYGPLTLAVKTRFLNAGDLGSTEGTLTLRGEGSLLNTKTIGSKGKLAFSTAEVLNKGTIMAPSGASFVGLTKGLVNEIHGKILAKSSLLMSDVASFTNEGYVEVEGEFLASLGTFTNSKDVKAATLTLNMSKGCNLETGKIQGRTLALEIEESFENDGLFLADHSLVTRGSGKFINRKHMLSKGPLTLRNKTFVNHDHVQAEGITLGREVTVENSQKAKILSKTQVESEKGASLDNEGLVSTEGALTFLHSRYQNKGRLEAQGTISFPNCLTFVNPKDGVLVSTTGQILLPQVKSFVNEGILSTQGDFSLSSLTTFTNQGKLQSGATLALSGSENLVNQGDMEGSLSVTIKTPQNFSNQGKITSSKGAVNIEAYHLENTSRKILHGKTKVTLTAKNTLTNSGDITSLGTIELQATHVSNLHKITGDQGVIIRGIPTGHSAPVKLPSTDSFGDLMKSLLQPPTHETAQTFTNEGGAILESSQGLVKAQAHAIRLLESIKGKQVEVFSNSAPLTGRAEAIESLYVYAPHGWSLEEQPLELGHSLTLHGPFLSPASLNIKGDFTWNPFHHLSNTFNIIVGGVFTLNIPGSWTNSAKVQAARGATLSLHHFVNEGAFYSGGNTCFKCEGNFENRPGRFSLMRGSVSLDVKGSFLNQPRATFRQEGADKAVTFKVGETIRNLGGSVFIEGQLNALSKLFANEVENPTLTKRTNQYKFWKRGSFGLESGPIINDQQLQAYTQQYEKKFKTFSKFRPSAPPNSPNYINGHTLVLHFVEEAVKEIAPTNPALFYAGGAMINAGAFQNTGGTFATRTHFKFNGPAFKHLTTLYRDRGKAIKRVGGRIATFKSPKYEFAYRGWCRGEYVYYAKFPFSNVASRGEAKLSSLGPVSINALREEKTGLVQCNILSLTMPALTVALKTVSQKNTTISPTIALDKYFDEQALLNSSFWVLDQERKTAFQWVHELPYRVMSGKALSDELTETGHTQITSELAQLASYKTWFIEQERQGWAQEDALQKKSRAKKPFLFLRHSQKEDKNRQKKRDREIAQVLETLVIPEFWEVRDGDLPFMKTSITPASLYESPPLMAVVGHPLMKGNERVRWHSVLAAELLTKSLMDNIGMPSLSRTIHTPELLLRVLEIKAYLESRRLHGKPTLLPPAHWEELSSEEQLSQRQIEPITWHETTQFQDPGVVFELKQAYGENVLSAVLTLPKDLRHAFEALVGKKVVRHLNLVSTQGDIDLKSPTFAIGGVSLHSARHTTTQDVLSQGNIVGLSQANHTNLGRTLSQHGQVVAVARQTCTNHGIMTGTEVSLVGRDVIVETRKKREKTPHGYKEDFERTAVVTATQKDVSLIGEHAVIVSGALVKAKKDISMDAPLLWLGSQDQTTRSQTDTGLYETQQHQKSVFVTGNDFKPHARDQFHIKGIDVICDGKIQLKSEGTLKEETVSDKEHRVQTTKEDDGWFGSYEETSVFLKSTPQRNTFISKRGVEIEGRKNLTISAPQIATQKGIAFKSQGKIKTGYTESSSHSAQQINDVGFIWQSRTNKGGDHTTTLLPHMRAPEGVSFSTPQGVEVTVKAPPQSALLVNWGQTKGGLLPLKRNIGLEHILNVLENTPETAWIKSLRNHPAVNWRLVSDVHKEWNETTQGLAPGAGALISLAVVIATQGAGASLMGAELLTSIAEGLAVSVKTIGVMADAGFTTLMSQTATSLIGNKFDLGKTFQELTSKESFLALGTSIGTAGLTFGLCDKLGVSLTGTGFFDHLQRSAVQTGASTGLRIMTDDLDIVEALQQGIVNGVANSVGGWISNKIGQMYHPIPSLKNGLLIPREPSIGWLGHKILHGLNGGLIGAASNLKDPWKGAIGGGLGAVMGESLMEEMAPSLHGLQIKAMRGTLTQSHLLDYKAQLERTSDLARFGTAFASFALKQDVNASTLAATNAIENNSIYTAIALTAAKVGWEIYSLTHEEEIEATKQEICEFVAQKVGCDPTFVNQVYDVGTLFLTTGHSLKQVARNLPSLVKKVTKDKSTFNPQSRSTAPPEAAHEKVKNSKVTREKRWMELANQPNSRLPKEVVDHVNKHNGKGIQKRFGQELAHKPKKSSVQGNDYSEAIPKTIADHKIQHRYLKERKTGTTISIPKNSNIKKIPLPKEESKL